MTYNQIISRIEKISLAHKQVRSFGSGLITDFLVDKKTKYTAIFLQDLPGSISLSDHQATFGFRIAFYDLVNVSNKQKENEQDVVSDCISIALDIFAQFNFYTDWKINLNGALELVVENLDDMVAGCYVDISVATIYDQNICNLPSDLDLQIPDDPTILDKTVYDYKYVATGDEGTTLDTSTFPVISGSPAIQGKKILLITREFVTVFKVSNLPNQTEFTWDDTNVVLGLATIPGERFLFLYRNY